MIAPSYNDTVWHNIERYDPALRLKWNGDVGRWELWRQGRERLWLIVRIENQDGSFRRIDRRLLDYLVSCDMRNMHDADPVKIHKDMVEYERKEKAKRDKVLYDRLNEVSKSQYARNAISNAF